MATRARLLDAAILVIEAGETCTMRATARRAGVAERTIYRHFYNRDELILAVREHLRPLAGTAMKPNCHDLNEYAHDLFTTFENHRTLIANLISNSDRESALAPSRRQDLVAMRAFIGCHFPKAPLEDRRAAAASLRALLSDSNWVFLRVSCGLANDEIIRSVQWTINTVLERLARS